MTSEIQQNELVPVSGWGRLKALPGRLGTKIVEAAMKIKKLGQDDPRRIIHSLKVGLAITLVSLIYYVESLYEGFGGSAMWAILTVIVVLEFSVGATLGRGLNRGLATFIAGALGFGAHYLASRSGDKVEPMLLGLFVFLIAGLVTFIRFFPQMKARYDYGLLIFMLTFCLVSISGYRDEDLLDVAHRRVSTILIGSFTSVFVCICICPVWAGDDLHNLVASNIENLGSFLQGFGIEYFKISGEFGESKTAVMQRYKTVLNSKQSEESLANFARWEPGHGQFRFSHPWKQYLKIGSLTRQCAYRIDALNGYLNSEIRTPPEFLSKIQATCTMMSMESGKALTELASVIKTMTPPSSAKPHIAKSENAAKGLKSLLQAGLCKDIDLLEVLPAATVASLLVDVVSSTEKITESINELATLARYESIEHIIVDEKEAAESLHLQPIAPCSNTSGEHHVITIDQPSRHLP
ncbi:aluminum-activated malate transporter 2-like [Carya illinoinensis]|uniref:Aluminum-activated malate transporter 2-like n=1 Tax=Carya illinoinensis TaxID=32201 RepID=A0A8T1NT06_CARIL|nr:aluminum-activated malate transporter 2-like [Carya illinoinensis]KAG6632023.1 hypothetical protein CIPAW_13G129700 [Carya illinoinensis]